VDQVAPKSKKQLKRERKATREAEGDPAEIGGYKGPWANYAGMEEFKT
jgi:hypothetical protein